MFNTLAWWVASRLARTIDGGWRSQFKISKDLNQQLRATTDLVGQYDNCSIILDPSMRLSYLPPPLLQLSNLLPGHIVQQMINAMPGEVVAEHFKEISFLQVG